MNIHKKTGTLASQACKQTAEKRPARLQTGDLYR